MTNNQRLIELYESIEEEWRKKILYAIMFAMLLGMFKTLMKMINIIDKNEKAPIYSTSKHNLQPLAIIIMYCNCIVNIILLSYFLFDRFSKETAQIVGSHFFYPFYIVTLAIAYQKLVKWRDEYNVIKNYNQKSLIKILYEMHPEY